jgi:tetratricopeptide (TPR) repeat protein
VLEFLTARLVRREVPAGTLILHRGARADFLAIITAGRVSLLQPDGSGQRLSAGSTFGEEMLRLGAPSHAQVSAVTPVTLWLLTRHDWLKAQQDLATQRTAEARASTQAVRRSRSRWVVFLLVCLVMVSVILGPTLIVAGGSALAADAIDAGRTEQAAAVLDAALILEPDSAVLQDGMGYVLYKQGDAASAAEHFRRAVELDSELASARYNLGAALLAQSQVQQAIPHLEAAVDLDPGHAAAFLTLGDAYLAAGQRAEAASAYQRAWSLDPALLEARARWAALVLDQGRLEDARRAWLDVVSQQPHQPDALLGLGAASWMEGRPAAALVQLQSAQKANPSDPLIYLYIGLAWQDLQRPEQAAAAYERVLGMSRDPAMVDLARTRLLAIYTQIVPAAAGQEGGQGAAVP